ncbi:beta 1-4 rhamnosyltransferase Cps2T [Lactovum odontotermitis]
MVTEKHVFIIGSKGIPAKYGGFETFVEELTKGRVNPNLHYHVACLAEEKKENFFYNQADCFTIKKQPLGPANAIFYDLSALKYSLRQIEKNHYENAIIYILACRIGPFIGRYRTKMKKLGITLMVNPDGHEWLRAKWSAPVKKYWKYSEKLMVKHADLLICDSKNIEKYIQDSYKQYQPKTAYIAYGADMTPSRLSDDDEKLIQWYQENGVAPDDYYLVVGRFVPENNYETMMREFMASDSKKDFVLITNVEKNKFYEKLRQATGFDKDPRVKFVGTVYDRELLKKIRENAFAYFHGHEVGGTNPSLIEALGSTKLNLLLDVGFNREVAEEGALYWTKKRGDFSGLINNVEFGNYSELEAKAKSRVQQYFSWKYIVTEYEKVFEE